MLELIGLTRRTSWAPIVLTVLANIALALCLRHEAQLARILVIIQPIIMVGFMRPAYRSLDGLQRSIGLLVLSLAPYAAVGTESVPIQLVLGFLGGLSYWVFLPLERPSRKH
jgi:hypothetical protein